MTGLREVGQDSRPECVYRVPRLCPRLGPLGEACQASHATVEVVGVCLKKIKTLTVSQAFRFSVLAWIFPPGSTPAFSFSQLYFFCSNASV